MVDVHTPEQRSRNMSAIKGRDTAPELAVRRFVHGLGYRYRLHRRDLPGKPDLVFSKSRKIVFVHGCFWHIHTCGNGCVKPKSNADFWEDKRRGNVDRDKRNEAALVEAGWKVMTIWECEIRAGEEFKARLARFFKK